MNHHPSLFAALLLLACGTTATDVYEVCEVEAAVAPSSGAPGDEVRVEGGPFFTARDTRVQLGGAPAEVIAVNRDDCSACDACREELDCLSCGACEGCTDTCATCVQSVDLRVPEVAAGRHEIVLFTRHGASTPVLFKVTADPGEPTDTDPPEDTDPAP
jgi:hypothetical protein